MVLTLIALSSAEPATTTPSPNNIVQLVSLFITAISTSGAITAWFSRKNKQERAVAIRHTEAEYENISAQAAATALAALRKELDAANSDLDKRRSIIQGQENRIERQQNQIRRLKRYVETCKEQGQMLETWVRRTQPLLEEAGVLNVPPLPRVRWPEVPLEDPDDDLDSFAWPERTSDPL
jgi:hypothetical protein